VLTDQVPAGSADAAPGQRKRRIRWRTIGLTALVLVVAFGAATVRLFVWPATGMPARVNAIVMMDGPGDRLHTAVGLARQGRAPVVVISRGSAFYGQGSGCAPPIPRVKVICFDPNPATTQGEAEFASRLARQYHWHSIALVTITPQDSRARLRMERCFRGHLYVMTAPMPVQFWPYELAYEWAATVKALTVNRSC
jgi:hypothetical protein